MKVKKTPNVGNNTNTNDNLNIAENQSKYQFEEFTFSLPTCQKCLHLERDILTLLESSEEYKRSLAISEAIKFLLSKINGLEGTNSELRKKNIDLSDTIQNYKSDIDLYKNKFSLLKEDYQTKEFITNNKIEALNIINSTLDIKVKKLEEELISQHEKKEESDLNHKKVIDEYEERIKNYTDDYNRLMKQFRELEESFVNNETNHRTQMADLEGLYKSEINQLKEKETILNKKLKDQEVQMYKVELENQNYKECIRTVNKRDIQPYNKLETINNYEAFNTKETKYSNTNSLDESQINNIYNTINNTSASNNNNEAPHINKLNIDEVVSEIKNTEAILKNYSNLLKTQETSNSPPDDSTDFRTVMKILEEKAEYLYDLKKRYNFLYIKLNNIN